MQIKSKEETAIDGVLQFKKILLKSKQNYFDILNFFTTNNPERKKQSTLVPNDTVGSTPYTDQQQNGKAAGIRQADQVWWFDQTVVLDEINLV